MGPKDGISHMDCETGIRSSHSLFGSGKADMTKEHRLQSQVTDRRFRGRLPLALQVKGKLKLDSGGRHNFHCVTEDIGFHGLRVKVPRRFGYRRNQLIKLKIRLYRGDFFIRARGKVCWVDDRPENGSRAHMGIRIVKMRRFNTWCDRISQCMRGDMDHNREGDKNA